MSFIKSFGHLSIQTRSYIPARSLHPKKFVSILSNVPTKPSSAWQLYMSERLNDFRSSNNKIDMRAATQSLSQKWKSLSEHEKQPYVKTYESQLKAYYETLDKVMKNTTPAEFKKENQLRKKYKLPKLKDPKMPKRPMGPFFIYLEQLRASNDPVFSKGKRTEQVSEAAKMFRNLSPEQSKLITEKAAVERDEYFAAMKKYREESSI